MTAPRTAGKLGRQPNQGKPRIRLTADHVPAAYSPPPALDRYSAIPAATIGMDGNDSVGDCSALLRPDFRDIDIRLILDDEVVASMFGVKGKFYDGEPGDVRLLLNIALSDLISRAANPPAPIDFQIQSMTEANVPEHGMRNPLGIDRGTQPILLGSGAI